MRTNRPSIILALCAALAVAPAFAQSAGENEPNIALPAASTHYAADEVPDRIVATPAQDASTGFSVNWRTNAAVSAPLLEIVMAGDSPDVGTPRQVVAKTVVPAYRDGGVAHVHRADVDGLAPQLVKLDGIEAGATATTSQTSNLLHVGTDAMTSRRACST